MPFRVKINMHMQTRTGNGLFSFLLYMLLTLCLLPMCIFAFRHPSYNWDMIGYMAIIAKMDQQRETKEIHAVVYDVAKKEIPDEKYKMLVDASSHREKFATDPASFEKVLPIFIVKPLYTTMGYLFFKAGLSLTSATVLPSIIAYLFIGLFLLYWLKRYTGPVVAFFVVFFIMYAQLVVNMAKLSTPDCLSGLLLLMASYLILEKRNAWLLFSLFVLAILTRLDNVIFAFFSIAFLAFNPRQKLLSRKQFLLMSLGFAAVYLLVVSLTFSFGWDLSYYSRYSRHMDFSGDFDQPASFTRHMALVYSKLITMLFSFHFMLFMALATILVGRSFFSFRKLEFELLFLVLLIGTIGIRFVLLPDLSDRFYFWIYLLILILLVKQFFPRMVTERNADH